MSCYHALDTQIAIFIKKYNITTMENMQQHLNDAWASLTSAENSKTTTIAVVGGVTAVAGLTWWMRTRSSTSGNVYKKKPGTFEIGSGGVDRSKVQDEVCLIFVFLKSNTS